MAAAAGRAARRLRLGGLAYLLLFSSLSFSPSLGDKRNGPFRMRENLWATGHFMGKKSMPGSSHLPSSSLERAEPNSTPEAFRPVLTDVLENMKDLLTRELLKILLQERILGENQGKRHLKDQTSGWFYNPNPLALFLEYPSPLTVLTHSTYSTLRASGKGGLPGDPYWDSIGVKMGP